MNNLITKGSKVTKSNGGAKMRKCISIVLAAMMLGTGCCTMRACDTENYWAVPLAVPADVVLHPLELVGLGLLLAILPPMK